jgi:hypothetical protein
VSPRGPKREQRLGHQRALFIKDSTFCHHEVSPGSQDVAFGFDSSALDGLQEVYFELHGCDLCASGHGGIGRDGSDGVRNGSQNAAMYYPVKLLVPGLYPHAEDDMPFL